MKKRKKIETPLPPIESRRSLLSVKQRRSEDRQKREAIRHMLDISMKQYRKLQKSVRKGANEEEVRAQISRWNGDMKSVCHFGTETI